MAVPEMISIPGPGHSWQDIAVLFISDKSWALVIYGGAVNLGMYFFDRGMCCRRSELVEMAGRVKQMRQLLYEKLKVHEITWPHVINQTGMFSFTGLSR